MKILICILLLLSTECLSQDLKPILPVLEKYKNKEKKYAKRARYIIRNELLREHAYNRLSINSLLRDVDLIIIPMFEILPDAINEYTSANALLTSIKLSSSINFHSILMRKDNTFIGAYDCNDLGACGVSIYKDMPSSHKKYITKLDVLFESDFDYIFYIRGILHAWWIVKPEGIMVYSLQENFFYTPSQFLGTFYSPDKIKKIIEYYQY